MKDPIARLRKKSRFVVELRYKVVPTLLDQRGQVIASIHPRIEEFFEHWRSDLSEIVFLDSLENPRAEFAVTPKKLAVILEDCGDVPSFLDRAEKYLRMALEHVLPGVTVLTRVGVRFLEILEVPGESRSQGIRDLLLAKLHVLPDLPLTYNDSMVKLVHEHGFYQVGPAYRGEAWVKQTFKHPDENVPNVGVALDIDSFAKEVRVDDAHAAIEAVRRVAALSKSVEERISWYLGLLDG